VVDSRYHIGPRDVELVRLMWGVAAELRADTDGLRRLINDLSAEVSSLQQERAAVDPQEHAAVSAEKELLLQQLEDRRAETGQLRRTSTMVPVTLHA